MYDATIYDGQLATRGPWQALVTFQQLLTLADPKTGVVAMTPEAIVRRTTIPLDVVAFGLECLRNDGAVTTSNGDEGYCCHIQGFDRYRAARTKADRREAAKLHMRKVRAKKGRK